MKKLFSLFVNAVMWVFVNPVMKTISRQVDPFNWERLLKLHFAVNPFMPKENSFYGHDKALRRLGINPCGCIIEHGVYFADDEKRVEEEVSKKQRLFYRVKRIVTMGYHRKEFIENIVASRGLNNKIKVQAVGPYILGSVPFFEPNQVQSIKQKLGRTLLVYPMHSIETTRANFDVDLLIKSIESVRTSFDSVIISMYWHDLALGKQKPYEAMGYKIACSGRREDPYFLSRQKTLFLLADATLTNAIGTHVGYSLAMDVPCMLCKQEYAYTSTKQHEAKSLAGIRDNIEKDGFYDAFSMEIAVTDKQRELVRKWWGDVPRQK